MKKIKILILDKSDLTEDAIKELSENPIPGRVKVEHLKPEVKEKFDKAYSAVYLSNPLNPRDSYYSILKDPKTYPWALYRSHLE